MTWRGVGSERVIFDYIMGQGGRGILVTYQELQGDAMIFRLYNWGHHHLGKVADALKAYHPYVIGM